MDLEKEKTQKQWMQGILVVSFLILLGLLVYAIMHRSAYINDFFLILLVLISVYVYRKALHVHPLHFFLLAAFMIMHNCGVFGWYNSMPLGISYDTYLHAFFGLVSSLIIYRATIKHLPHSLALRVACVVIIVLGLSAFHELFEFAGALAFGEGEGVLYIGAGDLDEWDTQKDMFNNLWGGLLGMMSYLFYVWIKLTKSNGNINGS